MHQTHINFMVTIFCFLLKVHFQQVADSQNSSGKMCCYEYVRWQSWVLYQTILLGGVFMCLVQWHNTLRPKQNSRCCVGTFFRYIFLNENTCITNNLFVNWLWLKKWLVAINKGYVASQWAMGLIWLIFEGNITTLWHDDSVLRVAFQY